MKNSFLFLLILACILPLHGMKRALCQPTHFNQPSKKQKRLPIILPAEKKIKNISNHLLYPLCFDIQKIIFDFIINHKPRLAASTFTALACTNRYLNKLINHEEMSDLLIKEIAQKNYCSHESIAKFLHTKQAKQRLNLQLKLKNWCMRMRPLKNLTTQLQSLIDLGVDLNFTFNHPRDQQTALMIVEKMAYDPHFALLIKNNSIDINASNSYGNTVLSTAVEWSIRQNHITRLLNHNKIAINQKNHRGETPLLHSLIHRKKFPITSAFIFTIKKLLKAGADPILSDKRGRTPLSVAKHILARNNDGSDVKKVIHLLQDAIDKKHMQQQEK